jgi:hypothetical protein
MVRCGEVEVEAELKNGSRGRLHSKNLFTSRRTRTRHDKMMSATDTGVEPSPIQNITANYARLQRRYQQILDRLTPHMLYRWVGFAALLGVFFLRIVFAQGVSPRFLLLYRL